MPKPVRYEMQWDEETYALAERAARASGLTSIKAYVTQLVKQHAPEVLEAYTVSGASDFIIRFACASMTRYIELTDELIRECPSISNISTHVVMRQSKRFNGFPLRALNPGVSF